MTEQAPRAQVPENTARAMNLKTAVFLHLLCIFLFVSLLVVSLLKFYAFRTLNEAERNTLVAKSIQIIHNIENEIDRQAAFARDWGVWDESYRFMQDRNMGYVNSNMGEASLENLSTMGILYLDLDFKEFYSFTSDELRNQYDQLIRLIETKKEIFQTALASGSDRILLYHPQLDKHYWSVIQPIKPGDKSSNHNGYLLLTTEINTQFYRKLSRLFGMDILPLPESNSDAYDCLHSATENKFCHRVLLVDDSRAFLEVSIADAERKKSIYLQTETIRHLNKQIKAVFANTLYILLASGLLIILLNLLILHKLVLRPTAYLSAKFTTFAKQRTLKRRLKAFGPAELRNLTSSANLMLSELETLHRKVETLSQTDELTGAYNRRYFHAMFKRDKAHAIRSKEYLALLLLDLDFFKQFNDIYGHVKGDQCLQTIADILKNNVKRNTDIIARYGGEEFIILLSNTPLPCVQVICKRIIKKLEEQAIPHKGSLVADHVTCSIGGIAVMPTLETTEENLILRADQLLYQAKEAGRNQYILSDRL